MQSFADDINLFFTSDNPHNLDSVMSHELKQIYKYCARNKLSINFAKTKLNYMLISSPRHHPTINIENIELKD